MGYLLPVLKVLVVNTIILKLSSSLMFLISPVLDVIPLILALLNLNFHLLMLSMLLLEEFPSTLHQIQPQPEPQPHPELHLHLDHVSHSVLAQVSLAKLHTILMMMLTILLSSKHLISSLMIPTPLSMLMMTQVPAMMKLFTL